MELETEGFLVQKCRSLIEQQLNWGRSEDWTTQDFEKLSNLILEATHVQLSVVTLKRIWGKIRYDSRPTITTLNALAQFSGFENWRVFKLQHTPNPVAPFSNEDESTTFSTTPTPSRATRPSRLVWIGISAIILTAVGGLIFFLSGSDKRSITSPASYQFSSKKVVATGLPNTVVFDYDATGAQPEDSIFIQQSWDPRLSRRVSREQKQHTSIYYVPGFFQAKLRINDTVVKEHDLFIQSDGWLTLVEQKPVPVYFEKKEAAKYGYLGLDVQQLSDKNLAMQPTPPWLCFYNVGDLADVYTNDFIVETAVKNDFREGAAICQHSEIHLLFQGAILIIPLSIPGCVSELSFLDEDGKKNDLSAFGVDFNQWVKVRAEAQDSIGRVFVNDVKAREFKIRRAPAKFAGIAYRFQGTGRVDYLKISRQNGEVVYEDNF